MNESTHSNYTYRINPPAAPAPIYRYLSLIRIPTPPAVNVRLFYFKINLSRPKLLVARTTDLVLNVISEVELDDVPSHILHTILRQQCCQPSRENEDREFISTANPRLGSVADTMSPKQGQVHLVAVEMDLEARVAVCLGTTGRLRMDSVFSEVQAWGNICRCRPKWDVGGSGFSFGVDAAREEKDKQKESRKHSRDCSAPAVEGYNDNEEAYMPGIVDGGGV